MTDVRFQPQNKEELIAAINDYYLKSDRSKGIIGTWDVSLVTDMSELFKILGNSLIDTFNFYDTTGSSLSSISQLFPEQLVNDDINDWDVSNVTNMMGMFYGCTNFNKPLDRWNVSNVGNMTDMFNGCQSFNQNLNGWNVERVEFMSGMFNGCSNFNQPLDGWNVSNVKEMSNMFNNCRNFNQNLTMWNVTSVRSWRNIFTGSSMNISNIPDKFKPLPRQPTRRSPHISLPDDVPFVASEPVESVTIPIKLTDTIMDIISGEDKTIQELLTEENNIIFYFGDQPSFTITKEQLMNVKNDGGNTKYGCKEANGIIGNSNVFLDTIYLTLRSMGSTTGGIIKLSQINYILDNNIRIVRIVRDPPLREFVSTVSIRARSGVRNALVSASHCNAGQNEKVYNLQSIEIPSTKGGRICTRKMKKGQGKRKTRKVNKKSRKYASKRRYRK